ncbi:uncharacterized protein LOC144115535 isoform X2 [Amblyomma americanum]
MLRPEHMVESELRYVDTTRTFVSEFRRPQVHGGPLADGDISSKARAHTDLQRECGLCQRPAAFDPPPSLPHRPLQEHRGYLCTSPVPSRAAGPRQQWSSTGPTGTSWASPPSALTSGNPQRPQMLALKACGRRRR